MIFNTEKQLKEYGDKIPADKKADIESALSELNEAHKAQDLDAIDNATQKLNTAWQAASQDLYQAANETGADDTAPNAGAAGGSTGNSGADDVTDAEYEEVK